MFRPYIVRQAQQQSGLAGKLWYALCLGSYDLSEKALRYDEKWIFALAVVGIPAAHGLHGYVGFVFGSLKSREWWSSDLMPVVFLFSAVISGVALLIVLYVLSCKAAQDRGRPGVPEGTGVRAVGIRNGYARRWRGWNSPTSSTRAVKGSR